MEENLECYDFREYYFNNGELDEIIDATYIIHLKDNGRFESIIQQLKFFTPTKLVYVVFNKGFKKCKKSDFIKISSDDLIDANLQILKHSKKMNYDNILILEDDFIFSPKINDSFHKNNVINFCKNNNNKPFYYLLGCTPILLLPQDYYNYKIILSGGTHAVIYNKQMIDYLINLDQTKMTDWDGLNLEISNKYTYYLPLCYQLFPETENSKEWGVKFNFIIYYLTQIMPKIFKILNMDKNVEPGYSIFYIFSKLISFIIFILLILLIIKLYMLFITPTFKKYKKT